MGADCFSQGTHQNCPRSVEGAAVTVVNTGDTQRTVLGASTQVHPQFRRMEAPMREPRQHQQGNTTGPDDNPELDDHEGADAFETSESAQEEPRKGSGERQDEEIITLDTPD